MYMAPVTRAKAAPSRRALRRAVGVPMLLVAALLALPWLALTLLVAGLLLAGKFLIEATDYAGSIALGR